MVTLSVPSKTNELSKVLDFIAAGLEVYECPMQLFQEFFDAVEEIFLRIIAYAFPDREGIVKISMNFIETQQAIEILFSNEGIPYNPLGGLEKSALSPYENKQEGNYGVTLLKERTDQACYLYLNERNVTTVKKSLL